MNHREKEEQEYKMQRGCREVKEIKLKTEKMLRFRWKVAGGANFPFRTKAIAEIFKLSGGIPRSICKLADATLIEAYAKRVKQVTEDMVKTAIATLPETEDND